MRADRLISLLMLLQARGRMTAAALAASLEVSERTIYRDVDALSAAGVPVYGEPGADGGYALLDRYRTTLTGLTQNEIRALFMLTLPAPLADLGVSRELKSAWLKLAAALPEGRQRDQQRAQQRFHLDTAWWRRDEDALPHLQALQQAVWEDRRLLIRYRARPAEIERLVEPYGLAAKAGLWYLVYARNERVRVRRVSDLLDARLHDSTFVRPPDFDLAAFWAAWCAERQEAQSGYAATVRAAPRIIPELIRHFGHRVREQLNAGTAAGDEGWVVLNLPFESLEAARDRILDFGSSVEVLAPRELRASVLDVALQIAGLYAGKEPWP